ncbi:MAG: hypothetical protein LBU27_08205 [Candidatus Peribacteria bacterium]|jgi:hypothetical protein|nr:hypothetical protein [Candidatus Peribacteria bacterium]
MSKDTATYVAPYKGDRPEASFWTKLAAGAVHAPIGAVWNTGKTILDTTWRSVATLPVRTTNIFRKKENRISLWKDRTKNMKKRWGKEGYIGGFKQLRATPSTPAPAPTENIKKSV